MANNRDELGSDIIYNGIYRMKELEQGRLEDYVICRTCGKKIVCNLGRENRSCIKEKQNARVSVVNDTVYCFCHKHGLGIGCDRMWYEENLNPSYKDTDVNLLNDLSIKEHKEPIKDEIPREVKPVLERYSRSTKVDKIAKLSRERLKTISVAIISLILLIIFGSLLVGS